ncbi:MAG: hypothetical protein ACR2H3_14120, partial [Acidimicrobiales bacterium]
MRVGAQAHENALRLKAVGDSVIKRITARLDTEKGTYPPQGLPQVAELSPTSLRERRREEMSEAHTVDPQPRADLGDGRSRAPGTLGTVSVSHRSTTSARGAPDLDGNGRAAATMASSILQTPRRIDRHQKLDLLVNFASSKW